MCIYLCKNIGNSVYFSHVLFSCKYFGISYLYRWQLKWRSPSHYYSVVLFIYEDVIFFFWVQYLKFFFSFNKTTTESHILYGWILMENILGWKVMNNWKSILQLTRNNFFFSVYFFIYFAKFHFGLLSSWFWLNGQLLQNTVCLHVISLFETEILHFFQ